MYIVKCSSCGYQLTQNNQIILYAGEKVASLIAVECSSCSSFGEKRRKVASIFNDYDIRCPQCKRAGEWTWL
ncbi:MAG: hypothetical protein GXO22_04675 [Aquificae bacterium]|nr:hypothetical protein [Aquificota bacterium]